MTDSERTLVLGYLNRFFEENIDLEGVNLSSEAETIEAILSEVNGHFSRRKFILGLATDFLILAELVSRGTAGDGYQPDLTEEQLFAQYLPVTHRADDDLATLTLKAPGESGDQYGIRPLEEALIDFYHTKLKRSNYPSAGPRNTGQWHRFKGLLLNAFQLSRVGRYHTLLRLFEYGTEHLEKNTAYEGIVRPRLFRHVIEEYPRGVKGENGGLVFQGIAYGFLKANQPDLNLVVGRVRTGSKRQKRIGDIDGYDGARVAFTAEVKDLMITDELVSPQLGTFAEEVSVNGLLGIAVVHEVTDSARVTLQELGLLVLDQAEIIQTTRLWSWSKQDHALKGLMHYLAHVEQDPDALNRLFRFVRESDPDHEMLPPQEEGGSVEESTPLGL